MKSIKIAGFISLCFWATTSVVAQKHTLKFNPDGKFKIVQFTDVHMKAGNPASDIALERIHSITNDEKPDLIIFTGDVTTSGEAGLRIVAQEVEKHKIPFMILFGNHDDEHGSSRLDLYKAMRDYTYYLHEGDSLSENQEIVVKTANNTPGAVLYCFDSHAYAQKKDVGGYAWLTQQQIQWYRESSRKMTRQNKNTPYPAVAFFHIPLPEYKEAACDEGAALFGTRMEKSCPPKINSGMFAAMREMGDIMGVFVGHDHDNDYAVMWHDIVLAYGRYTGGNTVYNNLPNGGRVIVLEENKRTFSSWIVDADNKEAHKVTYPDSFVRKNK